MALGLDPAMDNFTIMQEELFSYPTNNITAGMTLSSFAKNSSNSNISSQFSFDGCSEDDPFVFCYLLPSSKFEQVSEIIIGQD